MGHKTAKSSAILVLGFGLLAVSTSSIFIKICSAPAIAIACWRLGIASLFYFSVTDKSAESSLRRFTKTQWILALISGVALSLHFLTWITSLRYTSVASSVVLVSTSPMWVAIGGMLFLREKPRVLLLLGILLAMTGSIIISGGDFQHASQQLGGSILAMLGALFAAIYLLIGRKLRSEIDTFPYVTAVYSAAALVTLIVIFVTGTPLWGFDAKTYLLLVAIAVLPQIIGHTSFNWALRYFSATVVAVVTLGEPIGASLLAWIFLDESITLVQLSGGVITLFGLFLALVGGGERQTSPPGDQVPLNT